MADISRRRCFSAAPEAVWVLLADFGALATWADDVDHCCLLNGDEGSGPVGLARRVQRGHQTFVETIVEFDAPHVLAYRVAGVPKGFSVTNRWNVARGPGDATTVTLTSTIRSSHPLWRPVAERAFAGLMARNSSRLLDSLVNTVEGTA